MTDRKYSKNTRPVTSTMRASVKSPMKPDLNRHITKEFRSLAARLGLKSIDEALVFPKYFEIETVRGCNARCAMCTVEQWHDSNSRMKDQLFEKIAHELAEHAGWINSVCLSRNGEPLLDNSIAGKVAMLKNAGIKEVTFSTNASLLTEKKSAALLDAGIDTVTFSIDSINQKTFEAIRKGLDFKKVMSNCLRFITMRDDRKSPARIRIRMVLQDENRGQEKAFMNFWKNALSSGDSVYSKIFHTWGNQLSSLPPGRIDAACFLPCISPWSTMVIHFNGAVPLCGCDFNNTIPMGNVSRSSIAAIWHSAGMADIRKLHCSGNRNQIPLCIGCRVWDLTARKGYWGRL
jgi:MoaA/NifB/PqqE/SkfB family radical SAM enzyme